MCQIAKITTPPRIIRNPSHPDCKNHSSPSCRTKPITLDFLGHPSHPLPRHEPLPSPHFLGHPGPSRWCACSLKKSEKNAMEGNRTHNLPQLIYQQQPPRLHHLIGFFQLTYYLYLPELTCLGFGTFFLDVLHRFRWFTNSGVPSLPFLDANHHNVCT